MSGKNDFERQASMFTMNGLVDPRFLTNHQIASEKNQATIMKSIRNFFDTLSGGRLREKSAH